MTQPTNKPTPIRTPRSSGTPQALCIADIHDQTNLFTPTQHADLVLIAGDLTNQGKGKRWPEQLQQRYETVLLTLGKHDLGLNASPQVKCQHRP